MEVSFLLGFAIMWVSIVIARKVNAKEMRLLSTEKMDEFIDIAAGRRATQVAIIMAGIAAFYLIDYLIDEAREWWFATYALFIAGWMVYQMQKTLKEYRKRGFSESFIRTHRISALIRLLGILGFFICVGLNFVFY